MGKLEVSQRRIDANRRNAQKSTGPRTEEGKAQSRRNSLIHGLAGDGVVVPQRETEAARERAEQWNSSLRPTNAFEVGLVETIAIESVRIDRCRIEERLARDLRGREAGACWADLRKSEAARLGRTLAEQPEEIAPKLASTSAGCDWLIARWVGLGKRLDKCGAWSESQAGLALDLLGVAADMRELDNPLDVPEGVEPLSHLREIVGDELEALLDRKEEALDSVDDERREATTLGLIAADDPTLILLRRYETASFRRMRWALDLMRRGKAKSDDHGFGKRDFDPPAWRGPNPAAVATFPAPRPDPGPPPPTPGTPGPGGSHRPGQVPDSGQGQPVIDRGTHFGRIPLSKLGTFAGRTHLEGRLRSLARSLGVAKAAPIASKSAGRLQARPVGQLIRPATRPTRPVRSPQIRLMSAPAA
ncbi:hypothetical protein EP7_004023 [Isosphaeraceae bacterium EP7]